MILIIIGIVLIVVGAGVLPLLARRSAGRARTFAEVPHYDCAQIASHGADAPGMRVAVAGRSARADDGALTAPASGRSCVWYRLVVSERYRRTERDKDGDTSTRIEERVVSEERSPDIITLADATGQVAVEPGKGKIDRPLEVYDRVEQAKAGAGMNIAIGGISLNLSSSEGLVGVRTREEILPTDTDIYVLGGAFSRDSKGVIDKPNDGPFVISTRSADDLERGARTGARWFTGGAAVAAVAGVVLVVLGIIL